MGPKFNKPASSYFNNISLNHTQFYRHNFIVIMRITRL